MLKENIKDISYLILSLFSIISLYNKEIIPYKSMFYSLCVYTLCDILFCKLTKDVYIHHFLVFSVFILDYLYYDTIDIKISELFSVICLYFEVSSVFLAFLSIFKKMDKTHFLIKNCKLIDITNIIFFGVFIYYRIYYFSHIFLFNNDLHIPLFNYCNNQTITHHMVCKTQFYGTFFSFFLLNIYWLNLMTKILVKSSGLKKIISSLPTYKYENILSYTLYLKSILLILFYSYFNIQKHDHIIDIICVSLLSVASMYCHNIWSVIYKKIEYKKSDEINDNDIRLIQKYTIYDQVAIHLRSFVILYGIYGNSIYVLYSLFLHMLTIKQLYYDIYDKRKINKNIEINDIINHINNSVYFNLGATFMYDNLMTTFYNFFDNHCQTNLLLGMFIAASFFIRPFYESNQIYVHFLLIVQTILLAILNIKY